MLNQTPPEKNIEKLSPEHLRTLYEVTLAMNSSLEFDEVLNNVIDAIMRLMKGQRGFLMIADEETNQQHVLVRRGIDGETLEEEGYSTTIVSEVVRTRQPLLTNNAQFDTRYTAGQSIIMRGLRAILAAPMLVKDRLVGVVYVDTSMKSGNFTPADRDLLIAIAAQAGVAIENARLYRVAVEKGRLERELHLAREIQESLLPKVPQIKGYEIACLWESAREVAGDFYDVFKLPNETFGVVIADVSDKGAPAALFMAVARTMIRSNAHLGLEPVETVGRTNDLLIEDADSGMFVTVYHSVFQPNGLCINVNAGHNPPLLYRHQTHEVTFMPRGGRALGWFPANPLEGRQVQLQPGDVIVYYTDGLTDAENPRGDFFGEERLAQAILAAGGGSADEIMEHLMQSVSMFCEGNPPFDDFTVVVVRYTG